MRVLVRAHGNHPGSYSRSVTACNRVGFAVGQVIRERSIPSLNAEGCSTMERTLTLVMGFMDMNQ